MSATIGVEHRSWPAYVYVRQSTLAQVRHNQESTERQSICAARQSAGAGLDAANDPDIGSGPRRIGNSDGGTGRLQVAGCRRLDGPGGGGVCPRGVAPRALEPGTACWSCAH
jgi:hypothetical protein